MARRGKATTGILTLALLLGACGGDDGGGDASDGGGGSSGAEDGAPAECPDVDGELTIDVEGGEALPGIDGPSFTATSRAVAVIPIVLEDIPTGDIEAAEEAAAETDLLSYTIYLADHDLPDQLGIGGATPPEGGTSIGFSVVPPTEEPLAVGDVVESGTPEFESTSTFGTVGALYQSSEATDVFLAADTDGSGTIEILHLDDEQLCLRFTQEGTIFGGDADGEVWSVDAVLSGRLAERATLGLS